MWALHVSFFFNLSLEGPTHADTLGCPPTQRTDDTGGVARMTQHVDVVVFRPPRTDTCTAALARGKAQAQQSLSAAVEVTRSEARSQPVFPQWAAAAYPI